MSGSKIIGKSIIDGVIGGLTGRHSSVPRFHYESTGRRSVTFVAEAGHTYQLAYETENLTWRPVVFNVTSEGEERVSVGDRGSLKRVQT